MNYENNWNALKEYLKSLAMYYNSGVMCSMSESFIGENVCKDILSQMEKLETEKEN